jgi:hypothetical protein
MARFSPFKEKQVEAVFASYPSTLRKKLMRLRQLIFDTAAKTECVGELTETLKWHEPAYLPKKPGVGTTIRINAIKGSDNRYAMFVHCQTTLMDTFRQHYSDQLKFDGNRAVLFDTDRDLPHEPLRHCIALALTYHARNSGKSA